MKIIYVNIVLLFAVILLSSFNSTGSKVLSKNKVKKAYYQSSYGRLHFNELLIRRRVQDDEFLSNIFEKNALGYDNLQKLVAQPDSLFNEKKIRAGNKYAICYKIEASGISADKFIYEKNKVDFVVATLNESFQLELKHKEVETKEFIRSGVINSSLYLTMQNNETNPLLAVNLSEVYAWTIDFYKIQKGDAYKILYTEKYVEGYSLNEFEIKAAIFTHRGTDKEAYFYKGKDDLVGHFYDEEGGNMKQAFLKAPVKYSRISSVFSPKRFHPVQKKWKAHLGTDYAAAKGTPIYATADGTVIASQYKKYNGNYVKIKHNGVYSTQYLHMSKRAVKNGQYVTQGQVIGYVGSTGLATGPHVCYRFWKNGKQVDPSKQNLPKAEPIETKYLENYLETIKPLRKKLKSNENYEA